MNQPLVSVAMITYQHAPYIARAIENVVTQQTDFPFELVIGEDCSTDGTREIVFEYRKKYPDIIRVITSESNVGGKKNADRTGNACRGKYLAYCEGDDYWQNSFKLQRQVDYLEKNPECGLVYSSFDVYHIRSKKRIPHFLKYRNLETLHDWTIHDFVKSGRGNLGILTCTVMVRKNLRDRIIASDHFLYNSNAFLMRDTPLWVEIATKAYIHYIPESMATHNIIPGSFTQNRDIKKRYRFRVSGAEVMIYLCEKHNLPKAFKDRYIAHCCFCRLRLAFYTRDLDMAEQAIKKNVEFSWKDRLFYIGLKNIGLWYFLRTALFIYDSLRKKQAGWL